MACRRAASARSLFNRSLTAQPEPVLGRAKPDPWDAPGEEVQDDGEIKPPLRRPDIADIDAPLPVRLFTGKILIEKVGGDGAAMIAIRRLLETALLVGFQGIVAHQAGGAMAAYAQTVLT